MRKKLLPLLMVFLFFLPASPGQGSVSVRAPQYEDDVFLYYEFSSPVISQGNSRSGGITLTADAAILMDAETGQLLYAKNPDQPRPIASTTKIMTALLAIECGDLKGMATVSPRAAAVGESSIHLEAGERLTLEELLYGALLRSGNDACVAIAEYIAGREEIFVDWMNLKARQLGLKNTSFKNTNGLPHREHLSTARDLALISRHAMRNTVFNRFVSTRSHAISGPRGKRYLSNTNKMLWSYQGADGVKTGTTDAAGKCLVSSSSQGNRRLIAVVLHSKDRYADSIKLLDYGFANFTNQTVARSGETLGWISVSEGVKKKVSVACQKDIVVAVPGKKDGVVEKVVQIEREIVAPVKSGRTVGRLLVFIEGSPVAETKLITRDDTEKLPVPRLIYGRIRDRLY